MTLHKNWSTKGNKEKGEFVSILNDFDVMVTWGGWNTTGALDKMLKHQLGGHFFMAQVSLAERT